jgi:hypothetical protein
VELRMALPASTEGLQWRCRRRRGRSGSWPYAQVMLSVPVGITALSPGGNPCFWAMTLAHTVHLSGKVIHYALPIFQVFAT